MGDETVELLSNEASLWNKAHGTITDGKTNEFNTVHFVKSQGFPTAGLDSDSFSSSHKKPSTENGVRSPSGPKTSHSHRASSKIPSRKAARDPAMASPKLASKSLSKKRQFEEHTPNDAPNEETTHNESWSSVSNISARFLPSLVLDSDLELVLNEEQPPYYAESVTSQPTSPDKVPSVTRNAVNGLKLRMQNPPEPPKPHLAHPAAAQDTIDGLLATLNAKDREISQLKAELDSVRKAQVGDLTLLAKELHSSYSKQASAKLRTLYQRALLNARRDLEESSSLEVRELRELVELERKEKAELVKACDDYLRLNGF